MDIKPGLNVRIVTEIDEAADRIFAKTSKVYDVNGQKIVLAQTDPPILKSMLNKDIVVTYLVSKNDVMVRHGFRATILEFIDYGLDSNEMVKALAVRSTGEAGPYSIRRFYRVIPTSRSGLSMIIRGQPVNVLDISLGGAKISHDEHLNLDPETVANVSMDMNRKTYIIKARVLRVWDRMSEGLNNNLRFAALEFLDIDKPVELVLAQKIRDMEREWL
jgi:hypothetical protein